MTSKFVFADLFGGLAAHIHDDEDWETGWNGVCPVCKQCDHSQKTCDICEHLPVLTMQEVQVLIKEALDARR